MKIQTTIFATFVTAAIAKNIYKPPKLSDIQIRELEELTKRQIMDQEFLEQQLFRATSQQLVIPEGMEVTTTVHNSLLTTYINNHPDLSIFSMYVRDVMSIALRIDNPKQSTLIFAPRNSAVEQLSAKPWEFPRKVDENNVSTDQEIDETIASNIASFVESHIVTDVLDFSPLAGADAVALGIVEVKTINGKALRLKNVADGGFQVSSAGTDWKFVDIQEIQLVENGVILIIPQLLVMP
ncbi:hypothetical protein BABINDRAFT_163501 [Babjeviella inositovora NRRL Y-12698]|uniref:FAS1 domain-containing protein n=1 Tax=Babjeviella inositovora NRRL Y-12698 TaxID=984486 RepID=A0A1E3QIG7_9ASCO|nr:uncharacterized protein BABINDRAFT_163501 [Babjeviella inositovora NRRL Y-12698]ODQ77491.1 hypothetical protein BABINDRAFT_163501 [Babjeviella inositovora NRRL Y-12698]